MRLIREYKACSLSQINEAYEFWVRDFASIPTLSLNSFEEIFGQLFPDAEIQFEFLKNSSGICAAIDVLFILNYNFSNK
jgi:hypothetical protein